MWQSSFTMVMLDDMQTCDPDAVSRLGIGHDGQIEKPELVWSAFQSWGEGS